jgi:uncharacterized protein
MEFEWDETKVFLNIFKHGVTFEEAKEAFDDPYRIIMQDVAHSQKEPRFVCLGMVNERVMSVRFTMRGKKIRIIGAAYWRKGKKHYEKENQL